MKASELIKELQRQIDKYGDNVVSVYVNCGGKKSIPLHRYITGATTTEIKMPKYVDPSQTKTRTECVLS